MTATIDGISITLSLKDKKLLKSSKNREWLKEAEKIVLGSVVEQLKKMNRLDIKKDITQ